MTGEVVARFCLQRHSAAAIVEHQVERIVRQHLFDDLGDARKHAPDVQHFCDGSQQFRGRVDDNRVREVGRDPIGEKRHLVAFRDCCTTGTH